MTPGATRPPVAERRGVLGAFDRAIDREAHNLARWPELTSQQMFNRLQWEGPPVPTVLKHVRSRREQARPWIHTGLPFSEAEALILALSGPSGVVLRVRRLGLVGLGGSRAMRSSTGRSSSRRSSEVSRGFSAARSEGSGTRWTRRGWGGSSIAPIRLATSGSG